MRHDPFHGLIPLHPASHNVTHHLSMTVKFHQAKLATPRKLGLHPCFPARRTGQASCATPPRIAFAFWLSQCRLPKATTIAAHDRFPATCPGPPRARVRRSLPFKSLVPDHHAVAAPRQNLHAVPSAAEEQESMTGKQRHIKVFGHDPRQAVKTLSHVRRFGKDEEARGRGNREHRITSSAVALRVVPSTTAWKVRRRPTASSV